MGKRFAFDVRAAIPAAWDFLWAANLKNRAAWEPTAYRYSETYYLCAADVENQVREFAAMTAAGKPWSEAPVACGRPMTWPPIKISGNLQGAVRDWLLRGNGGRIVGHNFGCGHISRMRFRPKGEPLSEAEQKTFAAKEKLAADRAAGKLPITHYSPAGIAGRPMCTSERRRGYSRGGRSSAWCSKDKTNVTCPRCLKKLAQPKTEKAA